MQQTLIIKLIRAKQVNRLEAEVNRKNNFRPIGIYFFIGSQYTVSQTFDTDFTQLLISHLSN